MYRGAGDWLGFLWDDGSALIDMIPSKWATDNEVSNRLVLSASRRWLDHV